MEKNLFKDLAETLIASQLEKKVKKAEGLLYLDRSTDPLLIGQALIRNEIRMHNATPEQAAAILWCVTNGADSYQIDKKGQIKEKVFNEPDGQYYWKEVDKFDWNMGSDKVRNPNNFGSQVTDLHSVSLTDRQKQRTLYFVKKENDTFFLDRSFQIVDF